MKYVLLLSCLLFCPPLAYAQEIGIFAGSYHFNRKNNEEYNEKNPGMYITTRKSWHFGFYKNSHKDTAVFLGKAFSSACKYIGNYCFQVKLSTGIIYGYASQNGHMTAAKGNPELLPYFTPAIIIERKKYTLNFHALGTAIGWSFGYKMR